MKNKLIIPLLSVFFFMVIVCYEFFLYQSAILCDGWIIGDWLINYGEGFVRRGLSGSSLIALSGIIHVKLNFTVWLLQTVLYLTYMVILFLLVYRKKINIWFIIMLLTPVTLLFPIIDCLATGRKEIILFAIFAVYLLCLNRKPEKTSLFIFIFSIVLLIATLFHELIFFYTPYFVLAAYLKSRIDNKPFKLFRTGLIVSGSLLVMTPIFLYGKTIHGAEICAGLIERGLTRNVCTGILSWPNNFWISDVFETVIAFKYYKTYGVSLLLGLIPFILFLKYLKSEIVTLKRFFVVLILLFLFSSPLFILAVDWGRWINIHFVLLLFTATLLLKDRARKSEDTWAGEYLALPALYGSKTMKYQFANNLVFIAICFSYLAFWGMGHYGEFSIFHFNYYKTLVRLVNLGLWFLT